MSETINYKKLLRSAVDNDFISIANYNAGIYCYLVYRIVWETKAHYILFSFPTLIDDEFVSKPGEYIACVNRIGSPEISIWIHANNDGSFTMLNPQLVRELPVKIVS